MAAISRYPIDTCCPYNNRPGETDVRHIQQMYVSSETTQEFIDQTIEEIKEKHRGQGTSGTETEKEEIAKTLLSFKTAFRLDEEEAKQKIEEHQYRVIQAVIDVSANAIADFACQPRVEGETPTVCMRVWFNGDTNLLTILHGNEEELTDRVRTKTSPVLSFTEPLSENWQTTCERVQAAALEKLKQAQKDFIPPIQVVFEWKLMRQENSHRYTCSVIPALQRKTTFSKSEKI